MLNVVLAGSFLVLGCPVKAQEAEPQLTCVPAEYADAALEVARGKETAIGTASALPYAPTYQFIYVPEQNKAIRDPLLSNTPGCFWHGTEQAKENLQQALASENLPYYESQLFNP